MSFCKRKGAKFELFVYDKLKPVIPDLERLSGSGNRVVDKGDLRSKQVGILIECKHHRRVTDGDIARWFEKVAEEAKLQGLRPVLIFKENYGETLVVE